MKSYLAPLALIVFAGCTPNNATITSGEYTAFLSYNTSRSLQKNDADWAEQFDEHLLVDCRELEGDAEPVEGSDSDEAKRACRDFAGEQEQWLGFDAYHIVSGPLDPWRGEAVITSEGDLQVTFHNRLPDGKDFRFAFVVDPQFQPTECRQDESGQPVLQDIGGNWIDQWTADVGGEGSLFYLNAGAYQFNPSNTEDLWIFPDEWSAGFAVAKFSEEDVFARSVRYGLPAAYAGFELDEFVGLSAADLFYAGTEAGADPATDPEYQALITEVSEGDSNVEEEKVPCEEADSAGVSRQVECEFANFGVDIDTKVHTNVWRTPDGSAAGLDGWVELHYNWVHFDQAVEDLAVGQPASGEFHLFLDAVESQSRVLVKGTFEIEKIKKDKATVQNLTAEKLEEYETELCGQPAGSDAE